MAAALLTGVVAMGGLTSCSSDDAAVEQKPAETNVHKISIPASFGGDDTRYVQFGEHTNTVSASFVSTDEIYVYNETRTTMLSGHLTPTNFINDDYTACQLTGEVKGTLETGDVLKLVYNPTSVTTEAGGNYTFDYTDQKGSANGDHSASKHDFAIAEVKLVQGTDGVWTVAAGYKVEFVNQQSMFKFDLTFDGAAYNSSTMTINSLTISAGTDHLYTSRNLNGGTGSLITITNPSLTENKLFLALAFANAPATLTLRANVTIGGSTSDYVWTKTLSGGSFQNGKFYWGTAAFVNLYTMAKNATTDDYGNVVCNNGHLHPAKTAVPSGCTAIAVFGYISGDDRYAIALQDAAEATWNTITTNGTNAGTDCAVPSVCNWSVEPPTGLTGANWVVATSTIYQGIFQGLGSPNTYNATSNDFITIGINGTALSGNYWTTTAAASVGDNAWFFGDNTDTGFGTDNRDSSKKVRPVLKF